jgi:hypothetical protein
VARTCIWCGIKADSYEHVFPDWINALMVAGLPYHGQRIRQAIGEQPADRIYPIGGAARHRAKIVCKACNTGWMSVLEGQASPLLSPMIRGQAATLDAPQQLLAAFWAVKTVMVGETIMQDDPSFSQEDRDLVRSEHRPPLRARVSLAAYSLDQPLATSYTYATGSVDKDGSPFMDLYVHTIQVGHLVLSVRGTDTLPATDNRSLEQIAEARHMEIPVFPPVEVCRWPPNLVLDHQSLANYSGRSRLGGSE